MLYSLKGQNYKEYLICTGTVLAAEETYVKDGFLILL